MNIKLLPQLLLSICVFITLSIYSQQVLPIRPFEPLIFEGLNPHWYVHSYDGTFNGDSCDGYNYFAHPNDFHVKQVFHDQSVFSVYYRLGKAQDSGTYIEKRDVTTGELKWQTYYGLGATERAEFARLMYINTNGDLEVLSQIYPYPYDRNDIGQLFCQEMVFSKRIYDVDSGQLLLYDHSDYDDPVALRSSFTITYNRPNEFYQDGGKIRYLDIRIVANFDRYYYSSLIDFNTNKLNHTEDSLKANSIFITDGPPFKVNENTLLLVETVDSNRILYRYVDKKLNVIKEYQSDSLSSFLFVLTKKQYNPKNNTFLFYNRIPPNNGIDNSKYEILILDDKTRLLNKIDIPENIWGFEVIDWSDPYNIKLITHLKPYKDNGDFDNSLTLHTTDNNNQLRLYKNFAQSDSFRAVFGFDIHNFDDTKYLVQWTQGDYYPENGTYSYDFGAKAVFMLLVDKATFGITTSINDIDPVPWVMYPNPASALLNVNFIKPTKGSITIKNSQGQIVSTQQVNNIDHLSLDVSAFLPGVYYITHQSFSPSESFKVIKFVKI